MFLLYLSHEAVFHMSLQNQAVISTKMTMHYINSGAQMVLSVPYPPSRLPCAMYGGRSEGLSRESKGDVVSAVGSSYLACRDKLMKRIAIDSVFQIRSLEQHVKHLEFQPVKTFLLLVQETIRARAEAHTLHMWEASGL